VRTAGTQAIPADNQTNQSHVHGLFRSKGALICPRMTTSYDDVLRAYFVEGFVDEFNG
jgi:hypothetical protein